MEEREEGGGCGGRKPAVWLYAVEELYRRIVEEVAAYVAERGTLEREKYGELYRRFRKQHPLPAQLIQQAINQGVEVGESFLEARRNGRVHKPHPEVRRVSMRFAKDSWSYRKTAASTTPRQNRRIAPRREERSLDKAA